MPTTLTGHASAAPALTAEVHSLYDLVFADQPDPQAWQAMWSTHTARAGFRLVTAREESTLVGFVYGYTGEHGQWWTDQARAVLDPEVADAWLGGHLEVVSLAVHPGARGCGTGSALMATLLEQAPHDRAVLMTTDDPDDPAHRLYRTTGWSILGPGVRPGTVIMGRALG